MRQNIGNHIVLQKLQCYTPSRKRESLTGPGLFSAENKKDLILLDVSMSICSAIDEIYKQNPVLTRKELFKAGMRVGRDMMGTDSNTLILAFAGSSVSMLLLDYAYNLPYQQIINSNNIGIAIMQGLAGSFGIVLCVSLTVLICAFLFHKKETVS